MTVKNSPAYTFVLPMYIGWNITESVSTMKAAWNAARAGSGVPISTSTGDFQPAATASVINSGDLPDRGGGLIVSSLREKKLIFLSFRLSCQPVQKW
jgi:hypothetical protein